MQVIVIMIDFINSHLLWLSFLISGSCYLQVNICCCSSVFTFFIIVCTCFIIFNTLFALLSTLISIQFSAAAGSSQFSPSGIIKLLSNLIWTRVSSEQSFLCFWLRCSLFSFSSSFSSSSSSSSCAFLPACLSARGEATASLHAVNRSASERVQGRAGEDSWYGSTSETQPNKASPVFTALPCSSTSAAAVRLSNPLSQFVHFLLWFCFHGGIFEALIRKNTC